VVQQLRWDRADLLLYYNSTGLFFQSILNDLVIIEMSNNITVDAVDGIYYDIVNGLLCSSEVAVPTYKKISLNFGGTRN